MIIELPDEGFTRGEAFKKAIAFAAKMVAAPLIVCLVLLVFRADVLLLGSHPQLVGGMTVEKWHHGAYFLVGLIIGWTFFGMTVTQYQVYRGTPTKAEATECDRKKFNELVAAHPEFLERARR